MGSLLLILLPKLEQYGRLLAVGIAKHAESARQGHQYGVLREKELKESG
jgi:hypothetical protein